MSAAFSLVSAAAILMLVAGGDGTDSATLLGFVEVVVLPPVSLVAGVALLRRRAWARSALIALFGGVLAVNLVGAWRANPEASRDVTPGGVPTTVLPTDRSLFVPAIVVSIAMLAVLLSPRAAREFAGAAQAAGTRPAPAKAVVVRDAQESRAFRVAHLGRDRLVYEERHQGAWRRIEIDGEMTTGRARHAVYLASPERWLDYPEWARHRRDEIVARIRSELREPDYDYSRSGSVPSASPAASASRSGGRLAALTAAALLLGVAGGMSSLVYDGVSSGTTVFPSKSASQRRSVSRGDEPALFWFSIALYASVAGGCVGLVGWGVAQARRSRTGKT